MDDFISKNTTQMKMYKFLKKCNLSKLTKEKIDDLSSLYL